MPYRRRRFIHGMSFGTIDSSGYQPVLFTETGAIGSFPPSQPRSAILTVSTSWPHAARMSKPLLCRTVTAIPRPAKIRRNASTHLSEGRSKGAPENGFQGKRFTLHRIPRRRPANFTASPEESFTPLNNTYSNVIRCLSGKGSSLHARKISPIGHFRLGGTILARVTSSAA